MFPIETVERILSFCDGKTLYNAKSVNAQWRDCVNYLTKKTKIWMHCCFEEIPKDELIEYLEKYKGHKDKDKFNDIYANWYVWKNIDSNVDFDVILCPAEVPRITCLAVSDTDLSTGRFVAVGSEDGRIRIFNDHWDLLYTDRYLSVKITEISFLNDNGALNRQTELPFLIVYYKCGTLYLIDYEYKTVPPLIVQDVILYSAYKIYLCFVKRGGRVSIVKLGYDSEGEKKFFEITYVRIYSPDEVTGVRIWNGICTFLMNSDVKILKYDDEMPPMTTIENKTKLRFCDKNKFHQQRNTFIYRNDIIISISKDKFNDQLIELFILGPNDMVGKKIFNSWEVFHSNITCMFLYGNTFVLGVDTGNVYFYNIHSWKKFDIRKYDQSIIVGKHPIINIDVRESAGERKFYVASSFNINEVIGCTIINLN
ncbi:uncharacterized protein [Onthophagus taurus]|uniref:uncharacterized protein isoform X1 n=1 Tax=Onthophagus taurus TaxID=166361 RepID=UPI0039BDD9AD